MSVVHYTVTVWNQSAGTHKYWCLDCGREGVLRATEAEAQADGMDHAVGVHR
jgi:hypothetical protein